MVRIPLILFFIFFHIDVYVSWQSKVAILFFNFSPVYVDSSADIALAAKRVMWGKIFNCGQMVVAPDYVLCHADVQVSVDAELVVQPS